MPSDEKIAEKLFNTNPVNGRRVTPSSVSVPLVSTVGPVITLRFETEQVAVVLDRWQEGRDGAPKAEMTITTSRPDTQTHLHGPEQMNLVSGRSRSAIAQHAQRVAPGLTDWPGLIEQACVSALRVHRHGSPPVRLSISPDAKALPTSWLVDPLLPLSKPTVLFGPGGTSKSYLAIFLALCVEAGAATGLCVAQRGRVLYLDYESDEEDFTFRAAKLMRGHSPFAQVIRPTYWPMRERLVDALPTIAHYVANEGIRFVIVDSVAGAVGGRDLSDPATPGAYFLALRQLGVTSLTLAHIAKNSERPSIYGSVFFENFARCTWEAVKVQEADSEIVDLGLYQRKNNLGRVHAPIGVRLTHTDQALTVKALGLSTVPELEATLPLWQRIKRHLSEGSKSAALLADLTETKVHTVYISLQRHEGEVLPLGKGYDAEWTLV